MEKDQGMFFKFSDTSYHVFAGKEATRGLAKSSVDPNSLLPFGKFDDLNEKDTKTLTDWETLFQKKYPVVGTIKL
jgi:membrane-associated progesterone receptor component